MNDPDEKLHAVLSQWQSIEPASNFEANVWRRIRLAKASPSPRVTLAELMRQWMARPVFAVGAAAVVAVMIGSWAGVLTTSRVSRQTPQELAFMSTGTLAGGYVRLATEARR